MRGSELFPSDPGHPAAIDYIHLNPVRRGLCERAIDWKWSNARYHILPNLPSDPDLPQPTPVPQTCCCESNSTAGQTSSDTRRYRACILLATPMTTATSTQSPSFHSLCPLIQVFDMPTSLAFYRDLLGFDVFQQFPAGDACDWVWLRRNGAELMLNTLYEADERPPVPSPSRQATHSDLTFYILTPDVDAMYVYLRGKGLSLAPPVNRDYGMRQVTLPDPDGYHLCFQWPVSSTVVGSSK